MTRVLVPLRRLLIIVGTVEVALAIFILVAILANIGAQVFSRYVLNYPLVWVEELAGYMLIWLSFLAAGLAHKQRRHVAIALLGAVRGPTGRRTLNIIAEVAVIVLMVLLLREVPAAIDVESRSASIGLPIEIHRHWFFSVPLSVGAASMLLTAVYGVVSALTSDEGEIRPVLRRFGDHSDPDLEKAEAVLEDGKA